MLDTPFPHEQDSLEARAFYHTCRSGTFAVSAIGTLAPLARCGDSVRSAWCFKHFPQTSTGMASGKVKSLSWKDIRRKAALSGCLNWPMKQGGPQTLAGPLGIKIDASLVVIAVDLLEEGLGVESAGGSSDAGDDGKRNKRGQDGLHGYFSSGSSQSR
jgi:hypothetical protein